MYTDPTGHTDANNSSTKIILDKDGDIQVVSPRQTVIIYKDDPLYKVLLNGGSIGLADDNKSSSSSSGKSKKDSKSIGTTLYDTDVFSSYNVDAFRDFVASMGPVFTKATDNVSGSANGNSTKGNSGNMLLLAYNGNASFLKSTVNDSGFIITTGGYGKIFFNTDSNLTASEKAMKEAFKELWDAVYKQYPAARLRTAKIAFITDVLNKEKDTINEAAQKYGVPPEIVAGIIVKEQITQSLPDELALVDTFLRGIPHSIGLGAVFPSTAKEAWYNVDIVGAYEQGIYGTDLEIETKLMASNEASIYSIAVILKNYAQQKYDADDVSTLSMDQWKYVVGRYNASDSNSKAQNKYSDYVYEYLDPLRIIIK